MKASGVIALILASAGMVIIIVAVMMMQNPEHRAFTLTIGANMLFTGLIMTTIVEAYEKIMKKIDPPTE